jgi:hypothetical protein
MTPSVLGSVTLGYEAIWNAKRQCAGIRLFAETRGNHAADGQNLLDALAALWPASAPRLLLNPSAPALLHSLLERPVARGIWIEVQDHWLSDPLLLDRVRQAHKRGMPLIWSGDAGQVPDSAIAPLFHKTLRALTPQEALIALRAALRQNTKDSNVGARKTVPSPVVEGSLYQGLASQALVEHALDHQRIWGVAGWPTEEILHAYRFRQMQPSRHTLRSLVRAIEADASLDALEHRMGDEPLLMYRYLRYANSAHMGARGEVSSVRQGLMLMGLAKLRAWLLEQIPHAAIDPNLEPIRLNMVLRARIMAQLADAGLQDELRGEVFLCGTLSQIDLLLDEPLAAAIHRLPLPGRVVSALAGEASPYTPWLAVATALESSNTRIIHDMCKAHAMPAHEVNHALLRALASLPTLS